MAEGYWLPDLGVGDVRGSMDVPLFEINKLTGQYKNTGCKIFVKPINIFYLGQYPGEDQTIRVGLKF